MSQGKTKGARNKLSAAQKEISAKMDVEDEDRLARRTIVLSDAPNTLTPREAVFAERVLAGDSHRSAAMTAYGSATPRKADSKATIVMRREHVRSYLMGQAQGAAERIVKLSRTAKNESVRLNANQDILDRADIRPTDKEKPSDLPPTQIKINIIIPHGINPGEPVPFARGDSQAI